MAGLIAQTAPDALPHGGVWTSEAEAFGAAPVGMVLAAPGGRFVRVNDALCDLLGYTRAVLRATAERLETELRTADSIARIGGDEFLVLQEDVNDVASCDDAQTLITRADAAMYRAKVEPGTQCAI